MEELLLKIEALEKLIKAQSTKKVLTLREVAAYTGLSKSYLYKLTSKGLIPFYKPRAKMIYFERAEIEEWLLQNKVKSKDEIVKVIKLTTFPNPNYNK